MAYTVVMTTTQTTEADRTADRIRRHDKAMHYASRQSMTASGPNRFAEWDAYAYPNQEVTVEASYATMMDEMD